MGDMAALSSMGPWGSTGAASARRRARACGAAARHLGPDRRRHLRPEQLDRPHDARVRQRADAELDEEPLVPEDLVLEEDLLHDLLGVADEVRAAQGARGLELVAAHRRPAALAADPVHGGLEGGERLV